MAKATFAAGSPESFEQTVGQMQGVTGTRVGFVGEQSSPEVLRAVEVRFDPHRIKFGDLLEAFWRAHEPALVRGQQSADRPRRAVIFYHDSDQRSEAIAAKIQLERNGRFCGTLTTEILPAPVLLDTLPSPESAESTGPSGDLLRGDA